MIGKVLMQRAMCIIMKVEGTILGVAPLRPKDYRRSTGCCSHNTPSRDPVGAGIEVRRQQTPEVHYYQWSIPRWRGSLTRKQLDHAGRDIYRDLIDECYFSGFIPREPEGQALVADCTVAEIERIWPIIKKHFVVHKSDSEKLINHVANVFRGSVQQKTKAQRNRRKKATDKASGSKGLDGGGLNVVTAEKTTNAQKKRKETKRNETEGKESAAEIFFALEYPSYGSDETYKPFIEAYVKTGCPLIAEDFIKGHWLWRKFDFEQKAKAIDGIYKRIQLGVWDDPARVTRPPNYLSAEYKREVIAPKPRIDFNAPTGPPPPRDETPQWILDKEREERAARKS